MLVDIIHTKEVPEFQDHLDSLEDPEIINWCKENSRTWITHDFKARRKHIEAIKLARINVVWLRISTAQNIPDESPTWRIFKMLVRLLDDVRREILNSDGAIHLRINQKTNRPIIDWKQK